MRSQRLAVAATAAVVLTCGMVAGIAGGAATAAPATHRAAHHGAQATIFPGSAAVRSTPARPGVRYAVAKPACDQPASPRINRCYALTLEPATADTPGAHPLAALDGVQRGPAGGYTPKDLSEVYGFDPRAAKGHHMTIGIVDWYNDKYALRDLNTFDKYYHFAKETKKSFVKVNGHGKAHPLPRPDSSTAIEISLDIQSARAVCRDCRIVLVEAKGPTDSALAAAENTAVRMGADVVSNSFGAPEYPGHPAPKKFRAAFNHPGTVITASTGDDGWYGWDFANDKRGRSQNAASYPSTDPNVVGVSGTSLQLTSKAHRSSERVWNQNGIDNSKVVKNGQFIFNGRRNAAGGGCSQLYKATRWQKGIKGYNALGCKGKRSAADVAALADPYTGFDVYDTYNGGWITIGGTSLASPIVASMWALAGGSYGAVHPSNSLYFAAEIAKAKARFDVTKGGNSWCGGDSPGHCRKVLQNEETKGGNGNPNALYNRVGKRGGLKDCSFPYSGKTAKAPHRDPECNATKGFDGVAGVGVPNSLLLFHPTNPAVTGVGPKHGVAGFSQKWTARTKVRIKPDKVRSYVWTWGDHHSTHTKRKTVSHKYARPGLYRVTLTVVDKYGQMTRIAGKFRVHKRGGKAVSSDATRVLGATPAAGAPLDAASLTR